MKSQWRFAGRLFLALMATLSVVFAAQAGEPLETVKSAIDQVLQVLKDPQLQGKEKRAERIARLKEISNPLFDFEEMAKRSLGPHWRRRSPEEQREFVTLFRDLVEKIYADRIDLYAGEKVIFGRETREDDYAQVDSTLVSLKNEETSVVYRLRRAEGKWKAYDVVIENISVVNNYRSQFDRVIAKQSYDELRRMLKEKAG